MKREWSIGVNYGSSSFNVVATLEYNGSKFMLIRVHGKKSSILLETNYPIVLVSKKKIPIKWNVKEGKITDESKKGAALMTEILYQLEFILEQTFSGSAPELNLGE